MMTYTQIMEMFGEYLAKEPNIKVVRTRWGFVRLYCEAPYYDSFEAMLCRTPEELFTELLEHALNGQEYELTLQHKKSKQEIAEELRTVRNLYIEKFQNG